MTANSAWVSEAMVRLDHTAPDLVQRLRLATRDQLRRIATSAARLAVQRTGLAEPCIADALAPTGTGADLSGLRARVEALVERLDGAGFDFRPIPQNAEKLPVWNGREVYVPGRALDLFNTLLKGGQIVVKLFKGTP